jgi:hypothetical protein
MFAIAPSTTNCHPLGPKPGTKQPSFLLLHVRAFYVDYSLGMMVFINNIGVAAHVVWVEVVNKRVFKNI